MFLFTYSSLPLFFSDIIHFFFSPFRIVFFFSSFIHYFSLSFSLIKCFFSHILPLFPFFKHWTFNYFFSPNVSRYNFLFYFFHILSLSKFICYQMFPFTYSSPFLFFSYTFSLYDPLLSNVSYRLFILSSLFSSVPSSSAPPSS